MSVHPSGHYLATGCKGFDSVGCDVKLWDVRKTSHPVVAMAGHSHDVTGCRFDSTGRRLISCSKDGSIIAWDVPKILSGDASVSTAPSTELQAASIKTDKYFTSIALSDADNLSLAPTGDTAGTVSNDPSGTVTNQGASDEETMHIALGAIDGSISFYKYHQGEIVFVDSTAAYSSSESTSQAVESSS
jgi:WD40 repeat protein